MSDEIVMFNDVNPYTGMRTLGVKRVGQLVDLKKYVDLVPAVALDSVRTERFEMGQGQFTWHILRMDWLTRELIGFEAEDKRLNDIEDWQARVKVNDGAAIPVGAWTLEKGERLSGAIRSAAELYWGALNCFPQVALVRKLPKDAPDKIALSPVGKAHFRILARDWVWRNMVVVL